MLTIAWRKAPLTVLLALAACTQQPSERGQSAPATSAAPAMAASPAATAPAAPTLPSGPPPRLFAKRFVVKVRQAPAKEAFRLGYLRGGAVLQAKSAAPVGYDKCRKGWFELVGGGFVCSTVDAIAFPGTRLPERQSLQPDLAALLPYPYGYSKQRNTPVFRRLPTADEAELYEDEGSLPPLPVPLVSGTVPLDVSPAADEVEAAAEDAVPTLDSLLGEQGSVLLRRMQRGFYVSLDRELTRGARSYFRTQSNGFIPSRGLVPVEARDFHGVKLAPDSALPIAFVMSNKSYSYVAGAHGRLRREGQPGYHHVFPIAGEATVAGKRYFVDAGGTHYRETDVNRIARRDKPPEVADDEKWIDVDLATQSLVAYVGAEPVYATLISSGRIKDELDPLKNFETPAGAFRITSKHLTATMDGDHAIDGPYSIEDVPYVMYFQLAYALHSAFWHNGFGRPHSHGCINLAPLDAKWVFEFAEPPLPQGWHGVYPNSERNGTRLYIHGVTPQG